MKCVKQLDQNTCILPNSDGTCSGDNYTSEELSALKNGNELNACKIPLTQGNYLTKSTSVTTVDKLEPETVKKTKKDKIFRVVSSIYRYQTNSFNHMLICDLDYPISNLFDSLSQPYA